MFWLICLLGVAFVIAVILKLIAPSTFENYNSIGLAVRIILFSIGLGVIWIIIAIAF